MDNHRRTRGQELSNSPFRVYEYSDEMAGHFAGRSFAVVRDSGSRPHSGSSHIILLVPRHMTSYLWRKLFWHDVTKIVIRGREYKSLCSLCSEAMSCMIQMKKSFFQCKASDKTLVVDMRTGDEKRC